MTIRAKYFVEVGDVAAIRFECNHCRATVSLPLEKDLSVDSLAMCPSCRKPWLALPGSSSLIPTVVEFVEAVEKMRDQLADWRKAMQTLSLPGFSFELEITGPLPA